jgi:hypothetical protein
MEPQAESISNMKSYMSVKDIYVSLEVEMPEEVMYCPYTGSYVQMIHKAYDDNNVPVMRALIEYRDNMIEREKKVKELINA